jgi:hypothetical protein
VPHKAQHMLVFVLDVWAAADSCRRLAEDIGSIVNWPACIADSTDRRDSQLSEGARSSRTVGSLSKGFQWAGNALRDKIRTNPRSKS